MLITAVESYLALRRTTGVKLEEMETALRAFADFAASKGESLVRSDTALEWVRSKSKIAAQRAFRLAMIVTFARFLRAEDERHEIPPPNAFGRFRSRRATPFLFTAEDINAIVLGALKLGPEEAFQPLVYSMVFGLLACTGLRISEVLALRIGDVTEDGLIVRKAKFGKSRLAPLHRTTLVKLEQYLDRRRRTAGGCDFLFPARRGGQLKRPVMHIIFWKILRSIGLLQRQGRHPRMHDLRFHFANTVLAQCPGTHEGISRHMVALATYLGHSSLEETYWYLEATPGLLSQIAACCEASFRGDAR